MTLRGKGFSFFIFLFNLLTFQFTGLPVWPQNLRDKETMNKSVLSVKSGLLCEGKRQSKTEEVVRHVSSFLFGQEFHY